jgi:16S rRNA (uracil1498-N3)-methyltransferase
LSEPGHAALDPPAGPPLVFVADLHQPTLDADDLHHLARVLRVREGALCTISDGQGRWRAARFAAEPDPVGPIVEVPPPNPPLAIGFALLKGDRTELVVQKLTELGVDRIVPLMTDRTIARPDPARAAKLVERLRRIAREACMQSRRCRFPRIESVTPFDEVVGEPGVALADRAGESPDLSHPFVLVGPEGGWAPRERGMAPHVVGLGRHVLRAETAALAAGALLAALREGRQPES